MNETAILSQAGEASLSPEDRENWKIDITKAIDRLDEQERLVMALHYHEELTLPEIAQILDIPISKVKKIHDTTLQNFSIIK
ncbi:sigma-70 family RNA polymerase sigma factor [Nitrospinae bacterium]|nr:sigma-70 family RNA polymerase sigma factor [Nitrospinota bacterium]